MTRVDDIDRALSSYFDAETVAPAPAGLLEAVAMRTGAVRPRSTWYAALRQAGSMTDAHPATGGLRLGRIVAVALVVLVLAGLAVVGSRLLRDDPRLPPPFGPARNGVLAYSIDDDLYVADPATGTSRLLALDVGSTPRFSRDGTTIATARGLLDGRVTPMVEGSHCWEVATDGRCTSEIVLTTTDGRSRAIPGTTVGRLATVIEWSRDGRWLLVDDGVPWLVATDGSSAHRLPVEQEHDWYQPRFGGEDGATVWFLDTSDAGERILRTVDLEGRPTPVTVPLGPASDGAYEFFDVSPDGTRIAVDLGDSIGVFDPSGIDVATIRPDLDSQEVSKDVQYVEFSPDGTRVVVRVYNKAERDTAPSWFSAMVLPADGSARRGPEFVGTGFGWDRDRICSWAPDATSLFCNGASVWQIAVPGGVERDLAFPVGFESPSSWQRLAID